MGLYVSMKIRTFSSLLLTLHFCSTQAPMAMPSKGNLKNNLQTEMLAAIEEIKNEEIHIKELGQKLQKIYKEIEKTNNSLSLPEERKNKFVAVFDGGSTGTRLNIYLFDPTGLILKAHMFKSISPGIHETKTIKKDIEGLLDAGRQFLLKHGHSAEYDFPIVFNGTAGLRLLGEKRSEQILMQVKNVLTAATKKKDIEVRIIDGKEEGFYAWAALVFITKEKKRIAIIDLGGGSAQISFEIDREHPHEDGIVQGKKKNVLSRSFLGMGLVEGMKHVHKTDTKKVCSWGTKTFSLSECKSQIKSTIGAMIKEKTEGKEAAPGISQVSTVFVSSFISEILQHFKTSKNIRFQDIKNLLNSVCINNQAEVSNPNNHFAPAALDCVSMIYAVMFMESLGVGLFTPIKDAANIPTDISWSLGRALSLLE